MAHDLTFQFMKISCQLAAKQGMKTCACFTEVMDVLFED